MPSSLYTPLVIHTRSSLVDHTYVWSTRLHIHVHEVLISLVRMCTLNCSCASQLAEAKLYCIEMDCGGFYPRYSQPLTPRTSRPQPRTPIGPNQHSHTQQQSPIPDFFSPTASCPLQSYRPDALMLEGQRKDTTELKQQMSDMIEEVDCLKTEFICVTISIMSASKDSC